MRKYISDPTNRLQRLGFSLIELLVAIALLSLIMSLIYNAFYQTSTSTQKVTKALSTRQELRLLMKIVVDDLQGAQYLHNYVFHNTEKLYLNTGMYSLRVPGPNSQPINFILLHTAVPSRFYPESIELGQDPELHEVGYLLEFNQLEQKWVFIRREDFYIDDDMSAGGREQILSDRVTLFQLEFLEQNILAADSDELQEVWVQEWDTAEPLDFEVRCSVRNKGGQIPCLPLAMRVTLRLKDDDGVEVEDSLEINLPVSLQR